MKKGNLATALKSVSREEPTPATATPTTAAPTKASPGRLGKRVIAGHFDPAVSKQLKRLALDRDSTVQELLGEAINDLFRKHGQPPIA